MQRKANPFFKKGQPVGIIGLLIAWLCLVQTAYGAIPIPTANQYIPYSAVASPILDDVAADARPIGVGTPETDHNLQLRIGLNSFAEAVDIYLAIYVSALGSDFFLFDANGGLVPSSQGFPAWKSGITGPISENMLATFAMGGVPSGDYAFYLLIVPAGAPALSLGERYYLWTTTIGNLRAQDVARIAAQFLGDDAAAATAIMMALLQGYQFPNVVDAIMQGTLNTMGEISAGQQYRSKVLTKSSQDLPDYCETMNSERCQSYMAETMNNGKEDLEEHDIPNMGSHPNGMTCVILGLANAGYSATQIHEALLGTLFRTNPVIKLRDAEDNEFKTHPIPFQIIDCLGDISEWKCTGEYERVQPESVAMALFSDSKVEEESDDNGLEGWIDFDFSQAAKISYHIYVAVNGKTSSTSRSIGCDGEDCIVLDGPSEDPEEMYWSVYFNLSQGTAFQCQEEINVVGNINFFGQRFGGIVSWESNCPDSAPIQHAHRTFQLLELPFYEFSTASGKPAVIYEAKGASACQYIEALEVNDADGTHTTATCDEGSFIRIKLY